MWKIWPPSTNIIKNIIYIYISLPFIIFMIGWVKYSISLPCICIIIYCIHLVCKNNKYDENFNLNYQKKYTIIFIISIISAWVYLSGIGKLVWQNSDHGFRNQIFNIMVSQPWPLKDEIIINGIIEERALIYYIGFWLPSAVVGKFLGIDCGYQFQVLWTILGILILYYLVCIIFKKVMIIPLIIFIFFSGFDIIGYICFKSTTISILQGEEHLEWWSGFQFSSFTTLLFWVFNQAIPAWIISVLIYIHIKNYIYGIIFLLGFALFLCPIPFIGMLPFVLYGLLTQSKPSYENIATALFKRNFNFVNIVGGAIVFSISFLYMHSSDVSITFERFNLETLSHYIPFIVFETVPLLYFVYKYSNDKILYFITFYSLLIIPFIKIGGNRDFCMRASIPALVILYIMIVDTILLLKKRNKFMPIAFISLFFCIGAITPLHEINRTVYNTYRQYKKNHRLVHKEIYHKQPYGYPRISVNTKESFFFKYISKKQE